MLLVQMPGSCLAKPIRRTPSGPEVQVCAKAQAGQLQPRQGFLMLDCNVYQVPAGWLGLNLDLPATGRLQEPSKNDQQQGSAPMAVCYTALGS